jgi:S-DNA-T family DNA segregation ATPase FtsK/SpoIIIE
LAGCGIALYGAFYWKYYGHIQLRKKWNEVMSYDENTKNPKPKPEILRIIDKQYGCDCIVSLPWGWCPEDLKKKQTTLETAFQCYIKMNRSTDMNSMYVRIIKDLSKADDVALKLKWEQMMLKAGVKNHNNETFEIDKIIPQEKYGKDLEIKLTDGLTYSDLEKSIPVIESNFNCVTELEWQRFKGIGYLKMANEDFDEKNPFTPVETKPYELYFGQTYFKENIVVDMNEMPHVLIAGATGSGKSRCLFIALTNLLHNHNENEIALYLAQVSDKRDLQKFYNLKQTKYFAKNLQHADQLIKYILKLQNERNELLNKYNLNSIVEYNKKFPNNKMAYVYFAIDEFASMMPGEIDDNSDIKKRCIFNLHELMRQARSAGIFVLASIQRPDRVNMDVNIKNLFNIKIGFRSNNLASAKVLTDDAATYRLPNREAIFMGSVDKTLKTVYIDDVIIKKYLKNKMELEHEYVNIYEKKKQSKDKSVVELPEKEVASTSDQYKGNGTIKYLPKWKDGKKGGK